MLDLHLFLGRGLELATSAKVGADTSGAGVKDGIYGSTPQVVLDLELERIKALTTTTHGLSGQQKVMVNAYKMYDKTRALASAQSCKRAKEIEAKGLADHPILAGSVTESERSRQEIVRCIARYRPAATIFEQGKSPLDPDAAMMGEKRKRHSAIIAKQKKTLQLAAAAVAEETGAAGPAIELEPTTEAKLVGVFGSVIAPGRNKRGVEEAIASSASSRNSSGNSVEGNSASAMVEPTAEPRIAARPTDEYTSKGMAITDSFESQLNTVVFDVSGDDNHSMLKKKRQMKWDRKKKKYVQEGSENDAPKRIKTESGNYIKASYKGTKYKEWQEKTNISGFSEDAEAAAMSYSGRGGRRGRGRGGDRGRGQGQAARGGELLAPEQIVKNRAKKAKEQSRLAQKQKGKGRGGGSRGRGGGNRAGGGGKSSSKGGRGKKHSKR